MPLMPIVFSNVGVVGRGAMSGSESTIWEAPVWVLMAHTTPPKSEGVGGEDGRGVEGGEAVEESGFGDRCGECD